MVFFFWVLSLSARHRMLIPITLLLLPVALVVILVGCPLWAISAACGMKLHQLEGVYAKVGANGLQVQSIRETRPKQIEWVELDEVLKTHYHLCESYLLKLKSGSEVRVDFLNEGLLKSHLGEKGTRFQEVWGPTREPYPG
jgi:hypothetical protein